MSKRRDGSEEAAWPTFPHERFVCCSQLCKSAATEIPRVGARICPDIRYFGMEMFCIPGRLFTPVICYKLLQLKERKGIRDIFLNVPFSSSMQEFHR